MSEQTLRTEYDAALKLDAEWRVADRVHSAAATAKAVCLEGMAYGVVLDFTKVWDSLVLVEFATRALLAEAAEARDMWVPANGGNETPITKNGVRYLYCWNPRHGHAYLNLDTDLIVGNEELADLGF